MEKKRFIGVRIFALYAIFMCLIVTTFHFKLFIISIKSLSRNLDKLPFLIGKVGIFMTFYNQITTILILILWISFGIAGMFILRFKNWARKLFIFLAIVNLILKSWVIFQEFSDFRKGWRGRGEIIGDVLISLIFYILPLLGAIYFFSLPKIKTQFNQQIDKAELKKPVKKE